MPNGLNAQCDSILALNNTTVQCSVMFYGHPALDYACCNLKKRKSGVQSLAKRVYTRPNLGKNILHNIRSFLNLLSDWAMQTMLVSLQFLS